jgi:peptidoglycan/LPS O-acetylase OafA/YrhL
MKRFIAPTKLPSIDVLRGIAALGVAWYHSRVDLWLGFKALHSDPLIYSSFDRILGYFSLPISQMGGFVALFFILSGFCIHLPCAVKGTPPHWGGYAVRRFIRIYLPYLAAIAISFALYIIFFVVNRAEEINIYKASVLLMQNWIFQGQNISINGSLWTIPVEIEAYIFYPLLLYVWRIHGDKSFFVLTLIITSFGGILYLFALPIATKTFFIYGIMWASGAWLAEAYARRKLPQWTRLHFIAMFFLLTSSLLLGLFRFDNLVTSYCWSFTFCLLMIWALGPGSRYFDIRSWWLPPMVALGTISYSIYLIHFPLFKILALTWLSLFDSKPVSFLIPTFSTLLVIPFAWIFYHIIELPSHRLAREFGEKVEKRNLI